jgi:hypothetical protein
MRVQGLLVLVVAAAGCRAAVSPVPVQGTVEQLVGEWAGDYFNTATGRRGSILFRLEAGKDTAQGDVLLTPNTQYTAPQKLDEPWWKTSSQVLQISFVRCDVDEVSGWMKPYPDPETGELTYTEFTGSIRRDTLRGRYEAFVKTTGKRTTGTWTVAKLPPRH